MSRYKEIRLSVKSPEAINAELEKIAETQEDHLSRKGDSPNQMETDLDMNSRRIINLPEPESDHEPLTLGLGKGILEEATTQADRAEQEADRSKDEADRSAQEADRAFNEAERAEQEADKAQEAADIAIQYPEGQLAAVLETELGAAIIKNNVIAVDGLKGLAAIPAGLRRSDLRYENDGFYVGSTVGGGSWKWKSDEPKANHNGGTIVDPDRVDAWDGTQGDLATLFEASEDGFGCYVRIGNLPTSKKEFNLSWYGCTGEGDHDDTIALSQFFKNRGRLNIDCRKSVQKETITWPQADVRGAGRYETQIIFDPNPGVSVQFSFDGVDFWSCFDVGFIGPGRNTGGNEVCFDLFAPAAKSEYLWEVGRCLFEDFNKAGIYLGAQWCGTIDGNRFIKCGDTTDIPGGSVLEHTGGIVFEENGGAVNWSGSANDIANNYFQSCSYGVYNDKGWNVVLRTNAFEYCGYPYFKSVAGTVMIDMCNWMEDFGQPDIYKKPRIEGNVVRIGGRETTGSDNPKNTTYDVAGAVIRLVGFTGTQNCLSEIESTRADLSTSASRLRFRTTNASGDKVLRFEIDSNGNLVPATNGVGDIGLIDRRINRIRTNNITVFANINAAGLPSSNVGLNSGDVWNDSGTLKIVP